MGLGYAVGIVGVLILAHAAYSTIQYRSLLKITEEQFSGPPIQVAIELVAGMFFSLWAALTVPGKFLSILPQSDENSSSFTKLVIVLAGLVLARVVALPANLDFMIFNHRGKAFPLEVDTKLR